MYSGKLINQLFAVVEGVENAAKPMPTQNTDSRIPSAEPPADLFCPRKPQSPKSSRSRLV
jgi:hypothetical protein